MTLVLAQKHPKKPFRLQLHPCHSAHPLLWAPVADAIMLQVCPVGYCHGCGCVGSLWLCLPVGHHLQHSGTAAEPGHVQQGQASHVLRWTVSARQACAGGQQFPATVSVGQLVLSNTFEQCNKGQSSTVLLSSVIE